MSMIRLTRGGVCSITSKTDPRFDYCEEGEVGGFVCPDWMEDIIRKKEEELGCKRPDDLKYSYCKYRRERRKE